MLELVMLPFTLVGLVSVADVLFFQGRIGVYVSSIVPFARRGL